VKEHGTHFQRGTGSGVTHDPSGEAAARIARIRRTHHALSKRHIDLEFAQKPLGAAITQSREVITVDGVIGVTRR
jgi:hypothetical protein